MHVEIPFSQEYWDKKLSQYATEDWAEKPSIFAEQAITHFPASGELLELAAGYGQDGRFFASKGYKVTQSDLSATGVKYLEEKKLEGMRVRVVDMTQPLPFLDEDLDIVYCHLGIHYFYWQTTIQIVSEIHRILKPSGIIALFTNSVNDTDYGAGDPLEDEYFLYKGIPKRYFSLDSMKKLMSNFETILLDAEGTTYKDSKIGVTNLIRYIGRKPVN
ncbi:MAG: class I SAM-dependent methyltransferase [Candidatus Dojkabacteria bacterium]|nr:MAG: class I SAM-dependent methyltransferase [Candidatus Dojkabacteria bacterium]